MTERKAGMTLKQALLLWVMYAALVWMMLKVAAP